MKQKRIIAIILLCAIVLTSLCGCDRQKAMEKKIRGTWYYVNGKDEITNMYIQFAEDGTVKVGMAEGFSSVNTSEIQEFLSSFFGDVSDMARKFGLDLNISTKTVTEFFTGILTMTYVVKDSEEIVFTISATCEGSLANCEKRLAVSIKNGAPGGCPTSSL